MRVSLSIIIGLFCISSLLGQSNTLKNQLPAQSSNNVTIQIVGERSVVRNKPGVIIKGKTTGLKEGTRMIPYIKFPGEPFYSEGKARPVIDKNGEFTFQRKTSEKIYIYFMDENKKYQSQRLIIRAQ